MAVTASGWPYVTPTDHPKEYPAVSQALANKLHADAAGGVGGVMHLTGTVPSSTTGSTGLTTVSSSTLWGGVTVVSGYLVVPVAGWYQVGFNGSFNPNASGTIRAVWMWDGAGVPAGQNIIGNSQPALVNTATTAQTISGAGLWLLTAAQSIRPLGRQDCGSALTLNVSAYMHLIRRT